MRGWSLAVLLFFAMPEAAHAQVFAPAVTSPGVMCRTAVAAAERNLGLPGSLLAAISRIESGRRDPATGALHPWPWTANAEGEGFYFESQAQAVAAVRAMQARGIRSIDVGCAQVNLMHHPDAFPSLEAAFDPMTNAAYAGKFLKSLFLQTGDWTKATGMYHSATPDLGAEYQRRVMAIWPEEQQLAGLLGKPPLAPTWSAAAPAGPVSTFTRITRLASDAPGGRMIMLPAVGGETPPGRGLDSYRSAPIALAFQPPPRLASPIRR